MNAPSPNSRERVQDVIVTLLPTRRPTLVGVAWQLGTSPRSLQRSLQAWNTSFKDVLETARRSQAETLVRSNDRALAEIAYLLGYAHAAHFTRAFRRWTGSNPASFRSKEG